MTAVMTYMAGVVIGLPVGVLLRLWQLREARLHPRRSLAELQARARAELNRNPTIQVYGWRDGREHNRRQAEPWASFRIRVRAIGQAFIDIRPSFDRFSEQVQRALAAMPAASVTRPEGFLRAVPPPAVSDDPGLSPAPPARHPDLDVFDAALAEFESRMDCPHDSSSGGYGPDRTWRCDQCGEITGREPQ